MVPLQAGDLKKEFEFEHAEAILRHKSNYLKGKQIWSLPEDSKFEFVENGLRIKSSKGNNKKTQVQESDQ